MSPKAHTSECRLRIKKKLEETERGREILKRAANRSKGGQDQGEAIEEKTEDSDGKVETRMEDVEDENSNKKIAWGPPEIIEHETEEAERQEREQAHVQHPGRIATKAEEDQMELNHIMEKVG